VSRVLIVDDHPVVRMGLRALLERAPGFAVCGEAGSTAEALRLLAAERPDLTVLDLMLGGRGGVEFVAECLKAHPPTRILVLSQHDETLYAERVLKAGACGYLMKGETLDGVVRALEAMQRGEIAVSPRMNARILARHFHGAPQGRQQHYQERYGELSNREMQIFLLIGAGRSTGEIAAELHLSPKTVGAHRENIKSKLGLAGAAELEREALLHVEKSG
jgi:DNA-binding NarL/FixJ family response regulator